MWEEIAADAAAESPLWADALLPVEERRLEPVFSPLAPPELGLGLETIYEGYLVHYGRSRLFAPTPDTALLLGDYLYAHGLVRVAATGNVAAVVDLSELISLCAQARAEGRNGDGAAWAATAARLGARRARDCSRRAQARGECGAARRGGPRVGRRRTGRARARRTRRARRLESRPMSGLFAPVLADAAEEGLNIILSMLVVGLVFLAVIFLGDLNDWFARRRHRRHSSFSHPACDAESDVSHGVRASLPRLIVPWRSSPRSPRVDRAPRARGRASAHLGRGRSRPRDHRDRRPRRQGRRSGAAVREPEGLEATRS